MSTPSTAVAPGTRYLGLVVRGSGTVSAVIESNRVSVRATGNRWTPIHVAVPEHTRSVVVLVDATPGDGQVLVVADVGVAVRTTRITHAVATAMADGGGSVVRARVTPDAAGIIVRLRVGAHFIGTGRVRADGRVVVRSPRTGVPATLVTTGDASHLPARVALTLPG
ncbi:MAG: hypothetical protein EXQ74_07040 [Thermoleophilia bacterium]|nr:hypothetical protein [Thermoleophilia bacterium]